MKVRLTAVIMTGMMLIFFAAVGVFASPVLNADEMGAVRGGCGITGHCRSATCSANTSCGGVGYQNGCTVGSGSTECTGTRDQGPASVNACQAGGSGSTCSFNTTQGYGSKGPCGCDIWGMCNYDDSHYACVYYPC